MDRGVRLNGRGKGSQSLDLQRDALGAAGVDAGHVYHDFASGVR